MIEKSYGEMKPNRVIWKLGSSKSDLRAEVAHGLRLLRRAVWPRARRRGQGEALCHRCEGVPLGGLLGFFIQKVDENQCA